MNRKQVLAFFGAFNPPTTAHIALGQYAMEQTGKESVLYVPSRSEYIEDEQRKSFAFDGEERLRMLRAAAADRPWMEVIDLELCMDRQPRTYETLCELTQQGYQPALLMGSDKLPELEHGWMYVEEIAAEFGIVCMCRGEDRVEEMIREDAYLRRISYAIRILPTPEGLRRISSSEVRALLAQISVLKKSRDRLRSEEEAAGLCRLLREKVPPEIADMLLAENG